MTPRSAVAVWAAGFAAAAVTQLVFPRLVSRATRWGRNEGWQREIGIWNLGTLTTIAALQRRDADPDRALAVGVSVLSALFGANHLTAALRSPWSWGNWAGALVNAVGLTVGLGALASSVTSRQISRR